MNKGHQKELPERGCRPDVGAILNEIPGGVAVYEIAGKVKTLAYSDGLPKMQGYTKEEYDAIVTEDATSIVHEDDRPFLYDAISSAIKTGGQIHISYRVYCKDSSPTWVNVSAYPGGFSQEGNPLFHAIFSNSTMQFNLYRDICNNSETGILVVDLQNDDVYYVNQAMFTLTGSQAISGRKTTTKELFGLSMPTENASFVLVDRGNYTIEVPPSNKILRLHTRKIDWMNRPSVLIYASDITAEHQKQVELQRQYDEQVTYTRMVSSSSLASSMVNLTKNCITLQSTENDQIMTVITQQTPQEGFEAMYSHIPDPEIREKYMTIFDSQAIIAAFDNGITEKSIRHPFDSMNYWMESCYNAVRNPKTGDLEVYCYANDVTDDVLQQDLSYALMDNEYDDVILIHPHDGSVSVLIGSVQRSLHAELRDCPQYEMPIESFLARQSADEDAQSIMTALKLSTVIDALESQKIYSVSFSIYGDDGKIKRKKTCFSYLNKYKTDILCTTQDITADFKNELAQRESLQAALKEARIATKAKSSFLSNMSHDMRTPMNAILGLSSLAEDLDNVDELKQYMRSIYTSGKQLLDLINDTLDINRIESGKLTMNREHITSRQMLTEATASSMVIAGQKGVGFTIIDDEMSDSMLYVDKGKVVKIFNNILSNAIKFTPSGGMVTLTVKALSQSPHQEEYEITVRDTGIGMSPEFQQHIYEPFAQERRIEPSSMGGTGLGMTIVKEMVDFLGGSISIESLPDCGTEIKVRLTFETSSAMPACEKKPQASTEILAGRRILLAEDHFLNATIAIEILKRAGCDVTWVKDGRECCNAFAAAPRGHFDCIIMDIRMPVMDGLEAARSIRSMGRGDAKTIPIIAMSANAYEEDVAKSLAAGMNGHLAKPIDASVIYQTISKYL